MITITVTITLTQIQEKNTNCLFLKTQKCKDMRTAQILRFNWVIEWARTAILEGAQTKNKYFAKNDQA